LSVGGFIIVYSKKAVFVVIVFSLAFFSCAKKEVLRGPEIMPYEGPVTVEILKQSVGFGNVSSVKALAEVTIFKDGETQGSFNGVFGYKAPGMIRVNLFGPFGLTVTEILISGELLQFSVPTKNVLYELKSPEVNFSGLMNGGFRYDIDKEGDWYVLVAYKAAELNSEVVAKYFFDRIFLLNRTVLFYKEGSELIKADFSDFNGRVPERTRLTFLNGMVIDIALQGPEFDTDISDEYFSAIEHGDKQIKSFEEVFQSFGR
jgi:hypothetical protein